MIRFCHSDTTKGKKLHPPQTKHKSVGHQLVSPPGLTCMPPPYPTLSLSPQLQPWLPREGLRLTKKGLKPEAAPARGYT